MWKQNLIKVKNPQKFWTNEEVTKQSKRISIAHKKCTINNFGLKCVQAMIEEYNSVDNYLNSVSDETGSYSEIFKIIENWRVFYLFSWYHVAEGFYYNL